MTDQQARYLESRIANLERIMNSRNKEPVRSSTEPNGDFSDGDQWFDTSDGSMKAFYGGAFQSLGWGKVYVGQSSRNATWNQAITGVWFKPKLILIDAILADNPGSESRGKATSVANQTCNFNYQVNSSYYTGSSYASRMVNLQNYNGWVSYANLASIDSDGFTLNWTNAAFNANFNFVCFG